MGLADQGWSKRTGAMARAEAQWLDLTADLLARPLVTLPVAQVAAQLLTTFDSTGCTYATEGLGDRITGVIYPLDEQFGGHRPVMESWVMSDAQARHPILRQYWAVGRAALVQVADVPERFADRRVLGAWRELVMPWGVPHQLALPLPSSPQSSFVLGRTIAFTEPELAFAQRLWPLLCGLDRQVTTLAQVSVDAGAVTELSLTPRQTTVLGLLAEGLTAAAIGRRLGIAERTVHKHLERMYKRLGTNDRLDAVLRAQAAGFFPRVAPRSPRQPAASGPAPPVPAHGLASGAGRTDRRNSRSTASVSTASGS